MPDITISYKGNSIATLDASGTKTLLTSGKYCEDDIEVAYVSPGGGGGYSISAVFTQSTNRVLTTDTLDVLRQWLVVTAHYSDNTSETITDYSLSGTLTAGISTITVTALDLTTTFSVTVTAATDVTPSLSTMSGTNISYSYNSSDNSLLVYTSTNGTYRLVYKTMTFEEGMNYRFSCDVDYFEGTITGGFRNSSNNFIIGARADSLTASGKLFVDKCLSDDTERFTTSGSVAFCVTWQSSEAGRAVFRNIKVIKYNATSPEDALNLLLGGNAT